MTEPQETQLSYINYFNDYTTPVESMFLSRKMGLIENLRNEFPKIWDLYKQLKSLDWEETEMNIEPCRSEFKQLPSEVSNLMIRTLAWQYEADTSATHICDLMSPFVGCTELKCYLIELSKNECLTPDHKVLTPTGWKDISAITQQDKVAQWDYTTGNVEFVNPTLVFMKEHKGDIYQITSSDGSVDQSVTPSHRIPLLKEDRTQSYVELAQELDLSQPGVSLPTSGSVMRLGKGMSAREKIYTAAQVAASRMTVYKATGGESLCYRFYPTTEQKVKALLDLCALAGWEFEEIKARDREGSRCIQVYIPDDFELKEATGFDWVDYSSLSFEWCTDFLHYLRFWGIEPRQGIYGPYDAKAAEFVSTVIHLTGQRSVVEKNKGYGYYEVKIIKADRVEGSELTKQTTQYSGNVYCLGVPSSFFLVKKGSSISVTGNCLHSLAYKVIVESSFDNPEEFLQELVKIKESFQRLETVKKVFDEVYKVGHEYALGMHKDMTQLRRLIFKFWATLFALERIQFMSSFAITFGLAEQGMFVPIAKLVQKICTDEFQVHVQADKAILSNEMAIEANFPAYLEAIDDICAVIKEVTQSELDWLEFLFDGKEEIGGIRKQAVRNFVLYSATEVYNFYNIENPFTEVKEMPLPYMNKWVVIDSNQSSPQEESVSNYLLGAFVDDSEQMDTSKYELNFN